MMRFALYLFALILFVLLASSPVSQQERASGPVREIGLLGTPLHPLTCEDAACFRMAELLYPTLVAIDPQTKQPSTDEALNALASEWDTLYDETMYRFYLREDQTWSDGTPITAYDVFYSYLALTSERSNAAQKFALLDTVRAVAPMDDHTIAFALHRATCDAPLFAHFPVIPAHVYDSGFAERAEDFMRAMDSVPVWFDAWREEERKNFRDNFSFNAIPPVTSGAFRYEPRWDSPEIRLYAEDETFLPEGYIFRSSINGQDMIERFIRGEGNFIANPPFDRRDDLRAMSGVQISEFTGAVQDYIGFNYANPRLAGDNRGTGHHPLFADLRVRQAIQMTLHIPEIMEASIHGEGVSLSPVEFDLRAAEKLLYEAGWDDVDGDGWRECNRCLYARTGESMAFTLLVNTDQPHHSITAQMIAEQLGEIGIRVDWQQMDEQSLRSTLRQQQFDAFLESWTSIPLAMFLTEEDVPETGRNVMSYSNPAIDEADCDTNLEAILREDQAVVWLFAPKEFYAAAPGIRGFSPLQGAPLWNLAAWSISE